jgi:outer membrane protein
VASLAIAAQVRAEDLADAIALAYQSNPQLQAERADLRALDETYVQAHAGFRPQLAVSFEADYELGSPIQNGVIGAAGPQAADAGNIVASQTLFDGGLTSATVRAAMGDILAERQKLRVTEAQVLQALIQAYADVRRDARALAIADDNVGVLGHLFEDAKAQLDAGQYSRADLALLEVRIAGARAQARNAQAQLAVSRAAYRDIVGQDPGPLSAPPELPGIPPTLDQALEIAAGLNPAVAEAQFAEQAALARITEAKSAFRPTLSLRASYGVDGLLANQANAVSAFAVGTYQRNVTASVVLTQPIYAGGMNASKVRQAAEGDNSKLIALEGARRQEVQAVTQSWSLWQAARDDVATEAKAVEAGKVAVEGAVQETRLGDRTPLEELTAQQDLEGAELALNQAEHDAVVNSANLLAAMGRLEAGYLVPGLHTYDPKASFNHIRRSGAVPWEGLVEALDNLGGPAEPKPQAAGRQGSLR